MPQVAAITGKRRSLQSSGSLLRKPLPLMHRLLTAAALIVAASLGHAAPVGLVEEKPTSVTRIQPDTLLVDFGRVAFGNLRIDVPKNFKAKVVVHLGEASASGRVLRKPPGSVRYHRIETTLEGGKTLVVAPPPDKRNTETNAKNHPPAILTPSDWGVVTPFRWVEIEGWTGPDSPTVFTRRAAYAASWKDDASSFRSSDPMLDRIWDLCRHSIKATTFAGIYVDGDRERIPYEADAYLNQLSHYATDPDKQMARDTFDHLMKHGTWPTEWAPHMIFMAHADWLHTGDVAWLAPRFDSLKTKLLTHRAGPDGLIVSETKHIKRDDIVDWPPGERDGFVFTPLNSVVNAFHIRSLGLMKELATALARKDDAAAFMELETKARTEFQNRFYHPEKGLYRDGATTDHTSFHANLFPLAFGLIPEKERQRIATWLTRRGMRCSVYPAQYLLDALFENERGSDALQLITAPGDRSWRHMVESGTTITWEAWDQKYKPNQDGNHAWGAAPANLLPTHILGARPLTPGWKRTLIRPNPSGLDHAQGRIPTPIGPIHVSWKNREAFQLIVDLPPGMNARIELPASGTSSAVMLNGQSIPARKVGMRWTIDQEVSGKATFEVR